jgi:hypothetical protein
VSGTRNVHRLPTWDDPPEIVASCAEQYRQDLWASQPYRPEVWIEKDALTGVIEDVSNELRAPYFSCRGNVSEPEMYAAGKRYARIVRQGQVPIVLHLGDHDPNGVDMTRDIRERLAMFARREIEVRRIALNLSQVTGLPPNFAKENDSHYAAYYYVRQFGTTDCWELDAKRHRRSGARRARSPARPRRMGGSDRGRGRQPRRPGCRRQQLVLGQVCVEVGAMIDASLIARARDADLIATAQALGAILERVTTTEFAGACPRCGGHDRFSVNIKRRIWNCRNCGKGGNGSISPCTSTRSVSLRL